MVETTVRFSLRVPVAAPGKPESAALAALEKRWQRQRGVVEVETHWLSLPPQATGAGGSLHAQVEVSVKIVGPDSTALLGLFSQLSREAGRPPIRLAGRSCNLGELFPK